MKNQIFQIGRTAHSPYLKDPGIVLAPSKNPHFKSLDQPLSILGFCRISKKQCPDAKSFFAGLTLTAIEIYNQSPTTLNPVGDKLVFQDDIEDLSDEWGAAFRIDPMAWLKVAVRPYAFMLHASFYQYVSNVLYLRMEP